MKLVVNYHFDSAHLLSNYDGKCRNIHGHQWLVQIVLCQKNLTGDMIVDFKTIKDIIDERYDHCLMLKKCEANSELVSLLTRNRMKMLVLDCEPTAENLVTDIYKVFKFKFPNLGCNIRLSESPDNIVEYNTSTED